MQQQKHDVGMAPDYVPYTELQNALAQEVRTTLNAMCKEQVLEWHSNINGVIMFGIKECSDETAEQQ
jgi:hypothetical protein